MGKCSNFLCALNQSHRKLTMYQQKWYGVYPPVWGLDPHSQSSLLLKIEVSRAELGWLFGFVKLMVVSVVCSLPGRHRKIWKSLKITWSTQKSHSIKTHKKQDKSSISFLFKFPTDWGPCAFSGQNSVIIHGLTFRAFSDAVHFTSPNKTVKVSGFYEV